MSGPDERRRRGITHESGFTLIEVLISLALLGVVVALVGSSSRLFALAGKTISNHADTVFEETLGRSLLAERIEAALMINVGRAGEYEVAFEGDSRSVRFLSLRPRYERGTALVVSEFAIEDAGSRLLIRIADGRVDEPEPDLDGDVTERVIFEDMGGAAFSYLAPANRPDDPPVWQASWKGERRLPLAVRILFDDPARAPVIAPLRLTLPPDCASADEKALRTGCQAL